VLAYIKPDVSLEEAIGDYDDDDPNASHLVDLIADKGSSTSDEANDFLLKEEIASVLSELPDRDREVVELRFGLNDEASRTLEEVGKGLGVTRERIRQIEARTLRTLRHPSKSRRLRDFLD